MVSWGGENRDELLAKLYAQLESEGPGPALTTFTELETKLHADGWKTDPVHLLLDKFHTLSIGEIKHVLQVLRVKRDARLPKAVLANEKCIVCWAVRHSLCTRCEQWAVCEACNTELEGNCLQCLYKDQKTKAEERMKSRPAFEAV
jgi:hypothetical protein